MVLRIDDNVRTAFLFFLFGTGCLLIARLIGWSVDAYAVAQMPEGLEPLAALRNGYIVPSGVVLTSATSTLGERLALAFVCACGLGLFAALMGALVSKNKSRGARLFGRWTLVFTMAFLTISALCWPPHSLKLDHLKRTGMTIDRQAIIRDLCWPWHVVQQEGETTLLMKELVDEDLGRPVLVVMDGTTNITYHAPINADEQLEIGQIRRILNDLANATPR